jgi:hypothetical protein
MRLPWQHQHDDDQDQAHGPSSRLLSSVVVVITQRGQDDAGRTTITQLSRHMSMPFVGSGSVP